MDVEAESISIKSPSEIAREIAAIREHYRLRLHNDSDLIPRTRDMLEGMHLPVETEEI
jgi:hypothetical protein